MAIVNKKLGEKLRKIRIQRKRTQEDVAYEAKIDYSFYNQVENGKRNVSVRRLAKIAKALGVTTKDLIDF